MLTSEGWNMNLKVIDNCPIGSINIIVKLFFKAKLILVCQVTQIFNLGIQMS